MLRTCSSALLLSGVPHFVSHISEIAKDVGVELEVSDEWNINYRLNCEVIVCGSKYLPLIDSVNYSKVRLILKTNETVSEFVEMGITHFIFDYNNTKEVAFAFFTDEISSDTDTVYNIMTSSGKTCFTNDRYDFNFKMAKFKYCGVGIYLRESEKLYLADWLLLGHKDNSKRVLLCRLRKKFGKAFMQDVDRFGQYKGGMNG